MSTGAIIGIVIAVLIVLYVIIRVIIVSQRKQRKAGSRSKKQSQESLQLYIGNLSYRVHERDLRRFFSKFGEITQVKLVKDRNTRRSKGFGFVTYETKKQAEAALAAHGQEFSGRNIVIRFAKPKSDS